MNRLSIWKLSFLLVPLSVPVPVPDSSARPIAPLKSVICEASIPRAGRWWWMNTPTGVTKPLGIGLGSTVESPPSAMAATGVSSPEPRLRPTPVAPAAPRNRRRETPAEGASFA